jgi:acyl-CoA thioester hydrolase
MEAAGFSLPVIEAACTYHRPARYDDELEIRTTGRMLSAVRMAFEYEIRRRADDQVVVTGRTHHASLNPAGRPVRLPERVRTLFI